MIAKGFVLIQTKEVSMRPEDVKRVFQKDTEDLLESSTKGSFLHRDHTSSLKGLHGPTTLTLIIKVSVRKYKNM